MTCREFAEFIDDYLAGDLPLDVRDGFVQHLRVCENCERYLASYEQTIKLGKHAFDDDNAPVSADVPADLVNAILAARGRRFGPGGNRT